ncbi:MAG TPA: alpha/beta hydrolase, partial [Acidimicrobiia bacterium]|nr:alpha/beta hydrolase [Acidimicrobiia bacterium]
MATPTPVMLVTEDGHTLEGELATAEDARVAVVLCHPHPTYGGTMRSIVISALFAALPEAGVTCLRFNVRGVEGSGGA